jgi:hypothetical protein
MASITEAILLSGVLCGTLDAAAATSTFGLQGIPPRRLWQGVASGLLGEEAFQQGTRTVTLGLLLHYLIAFTAAAVFCYSATWIPWLIRSPLTAGLVYGILVFLVMNLIVVPLSARPKRPVSPAGVVIQLLIHIFCVGLPVSLTAAHFLR